MELTLNAPLSPDEIDRIARKRAGAKIGWYIHAAVYIAVNAVLFLISSQGLGQRNWSLYPALGWGLGLLFHGVAVWLAGAGSDFRERLVDKERERLQRRNGS